MRRTLDGSVVVITGASSGIGYATALAFARHRCRLVLVARDGDRLRQVLAECDRHGGTAIAGPPTSLARRTWSGSWRSRRASTAASTRG